MDLTPITGACAAFCRPGTLGISGGLGWGRESQHFRWEDGLVPAPASADARGGGLGRSGFLLEGGGWERTRSSRVTALREARPCCPAPLPAYLTGAGELGARPASGPKAAARSSPTHPHTLSWNVETSVNYGAAGQGPAAFSKGGNGGWVLPEPSLGALRLHQLE